MGGLRRLHLPHTLLFEGAVSFVQRKASVRRAQALPGYSAVRALLTVRGATGATLCRELMHSETSADIAEGTPSCVVWSPPPRSGPPRLHKQLHLPRDVDCISHRCGQLVAACCDGTAQRDVASNGSGTLCTSSWQRREGRMPLSTAKCLDSKHWQEVDPPYVLMAGEDGGLPRDVRRPSRQGVPAQGRRPCVS